MLLLITAKFTNRGDVKTYFYIPFSENRENEQNFCVLDFLTVR